MLQLVNCNKPGMVLQFCLLRTCVPLNASSVCLMILNQLSIVSSYVTVRTLHLLISIWYYFMIININPIFFIGNLYIGHIHDRTSSSALRKIPMKGNKGTYNVYINYLMDAISLINMVRSGYNKK